MLSKEEIQIQYFENEIFKIQSIFIENSLEVYIKNGTKWETVDFKYIGGNFVQISPILPINTEIKFTFNIEDEEELTTLQKINKLEKQVQDLTILTETLSRALDQRIDKHSFRVWIKAVEKKMNIRIIDTELLGIEGNNSYNNP